MGTVTKLANVIQKLPNSVVEHTAEWEKFVSIFLSGRNKVEQCPLGQGVFMVKSDLELPEIEEEFFDAIQGPEENTEFGLPTASFEEKPDKPPDEFSDVKYWRIMPEGQLDDLI